MDETQKIKQRYEKRKQTNMLENIWFSKFAQYERELKYFQIIKNKF